jgi:hypothetical protein
MMKSKHSRRAGSDDALAKGVRRGYAPDEQQRWAGRAIVLKSGFMETKRIEAVYK